MLKAVDLVMNYSYGRRIPSLKGNHPLVFPKDAAFCGVFYKPCGFINILISKLLERLKLSSWIY